MMARRAPAAITKIEALLRDPTLSGRLRKASMAVSIHLKLSPRKGRVNIVFTNSNATTLMIILWGKPPLLGHLPQKSQYRGAATSQVVYHERLSLYDRVEAP
eukprot:COSAG01_NODE_5475_length_4236_cov_1111.481267_1_plen_102_part_00